MARIPWYYLPQFSLNRLRPIEFFPPKPELEKIDTICIGTKTRTIGDALMLSTLPRKLKTRYPNIKRILTFPRGFNPVVFWNNPYVDGISYLPEKLFGDDCCEGGGHVIQVKDQYFDIRENGLPRPEIYLTDREKLWGENFLKNLTSPERAALPLLIIHPFGHNFPKVLAPEVWGKFTSLIRDHFRIIQVGVEGQRAIPGCDLNFLAPKKRQVARQLFALLKNASLFIGVDSGPMHIARAYGVRSLIVTDGTAPADIFARRKRGPYYLYGNHVRAFLYEDLEHLFVPELTPESLIRQMGDFVTRVHNQKVGTTFESHGTKTP